MKHVRLSYFFVITFLVITALLTTSCGDKPEPQDNLVTHSIILDFTAAFPYHSEVAASICLHQWDPETNAFVDKTLDCFISESDPIYVVTSYSNSTLYDCYVSYKNISNSPVNVHAPFGSVAGDDKTYEISFDSDKTYYWNDNAQYMVLR